MAILMMLILPIHEHSTCFHLFVSSLISFFNVVQFSKYRSFTSLVRFIPRYFIFLVAILNGMFFLISVSAVSLLVYRNAFDFWVLTLYPAVLPNSFIRSSSFFGGVYGILHVAVQISQHHLLKRLFFLHFMLLPPLSNIN